MKKSIKHELMISLVKIIKKYDKSVILKIF